MSREEVLDLTLPEVRAIVAEFPHVDAFAGGGDDDDADQAQSSRQRPGPRPDPYAGDTGQIVFGAGE